MDQLPICSGCGKPEPANYCWDGRLLDCPLGYTCRHVSTHDLIDTIRDLGKRVQKLETDAFFAGISDD